MSKTWARRFVQLAILLFLASGCSGIITVNISTPAPAGQNGSGGGSEFGAQTRTSGCQINGAYPDKSCTPGDTFPDVTAGTVCRPGYSSSVREVSVAEKNQVYAEYGITNHQTGQYEVDHLVSLELGGSNSIANLWPEPAAPSPGFHEKDKVENYLHQQVCSGAMTLQEAQREIATDWYAVYQHMPR